MNKKQRKTYDAIFAEPIRRNIVWDDRTLTQTFASNQLRLWLSSMAYVLMQAFRLDKSENFKDN